MKQPRKREREGEEGEEEKEELIKLQIFSTRTKPRWSLQWLSCAPPSHVHSRAGCSFPSPWWVGCGGACSRASPHEQCSWKDLSCNLHGCTWSSSCGTLFRWPWPDENGTHVRTYVRITIDIQQKWYLLKYILFDRGHVLFQWDTPFSCIRHISLWCQRMRLKPCLLHSGDSQQYFSVRGECSKKIIIIIIN